MANLIVVSGPQAVGKMTVAEKLKEKLGYSLMVNHDSLEVSIKIFENGSIAQKELNRAIRENVFAIALKNNIDMIFTFIPAFNLQEGLDYLNNLRKMFEQTGGNFYFVELMSDLETRLERNVTPHRLETKKSKNNIEFSNNELVESMKKYRMNTYENEYICENHLKIDNTNLSPDEVANIVIEKYNINNTHSGNRNKIQIFI